MTFQIESERNQKNVGTIHLNSNMWRRTCGRKIMFHLIAEEFVQARRVAFERLKGILSIESSPESSPDYDTILDAAKNSTGKRPETSKQEPPWKDKKASLVPAAGVQEDEDSPIQRVSNEEFGRKAKALKWNAKYGDSAMTTCAERLLKVFDPDRTIDDVRKDLPKGEATVYDILIHVMITYGSFTTAVEEVLKDIKQKQDAHSEDSSKARGSRPTGHAASSSSHERVKLEPRDNEDEAEKSARELAKERAQKVLAKCRLHAAEDSIRDSNRPWKRSRSRIRKATLRSAAETVSLQSASSTVELKPAERKRTRREIEEKPKVSKRPRSRGDIIGYIDPKFVKQRRWKIEFDVRRHISGAEIDLLFREEESQHRIGDHRTFIGPGADGSSDDRISVDLKYGNTTDRVTVSPLFNDYVKTTFVQ